MGFWSGLAKIGASIGLAPFTGGASLMGIPSSIGDFTGGGQTGVGSDGTIFQDENPGGSLWQSIGGILTGKGTGGKVLGTAGDVASGIEAGRAKDRESQNDFNVLQDRTRLQAQQDFENALENRAGLEMKQQQASQGYQGDAYRQALLGALGMNLQDVTLGGVPKDVPVISFNGGLRPSAMGPQGRAASALLNEKAMKNLQDGMKISDLPAIERFTPSEYKKGNALDTILGAAGTVGKIGDIWNTRTQGQEDRSWIDKLREEMLKNQKGTTVPTGDAPDVLMKDENGMPIQQDTGNGQENIKWTIDPKTGKPIFGDELLNLAALQGVVR